VFVPVLKDGYCSSVWCGKEWGGFDQRLREQATANGSKPIAIVPVLWIPRDRCNLAPEVTGIQDTSGEFPPEYEQEGLYALAVQPRWKRAYEATTFKIAELIHTVGQRAMLWPSEPLDWDATPNAFSEHQATDDSHRIRVRIAAYQEDGTPVPSGRVRDRYYYGREMREWMPYRVPDNTVQIAARATVVISEMSCHAVIDPLDHELEPRPMPSPTVMLVDPWAPEHPRTAEQLSKIDRTEPAHVVVPWNVADRQVEDNGEDLRARLRATLLRSFELPGSGKYVLRPEAFRADFTGAVNQAVAEYRRHGAVFPPSGPGSMHKPDLNPNIHDAAEDDPLVDESEDDARGGSGDNDV
jgi:FxsC-like protein